GGDQLGAILALVDRRRAPGAELVARCEPGAPPVLEIVRGDERILLFVALHDNQVLVQNRRAARAPFKIGIVEKPGIDQAQILFPEKLAVEVVCVEALGSKERDDDAAIGSRSRGGMASGDMSLGFRYTCTGCSFPQDL